MNDDYIKREDAQRITTEWLSGYINDEQQEVLEKVEVELGELPSADVVEVVRCKDCIHNHVTSWNQGKRDDPRCHFTNFVRSNEFYCGFGERAET